MSFKNLISFDVIAETSPLFLDVDERPDWPALFDNANPLKLEIGFGGGSFLIEMAAKERDSNFIGMDFYHKGIRKTVTRLEKLKMNNVRIAYGDAREKIPAMFTRGDLSEIFINFPDPWPKKRHAKRRLVKPEMLSILSEKLIQGGRLRLATDCAPYAMEMMEHLEAESTLHNKTGKGKFLELRDDLPKTKYEKNFIRAGDRIYYMDFQKV
ncbi:MAG: tRNA (guanosine(46)-N7)-methyltransferase TrmB [Candidatus Nitrohelix vancouverensis]|uniref:tRNA (guanine-N(7)-)-methyltransferase n=1 Tax=Candidatus Nitrohelix vancouverensis TaxID=2705534 RepID=A0A7T0G4K5_9BACT|nr:MAG: tRNA (guanosine(46)-N7)-methyltransferase TrmB [Candidatus Nitrohelix vancouverensis]